MAEEPLISRTKSRRIKSNNYGSTGGTGAGPGQGGGGGAGPGLQVLVLVLLMREMVVLEFLVLCIWSRE